MASRIRRLIVSFLAVLLSSCMLYTLIHIWVDGATYVGEPILWIRLAETLGLGVILAFLLYCLVEEVLKR